MNNTEQKIHEIADRIASNGDKPTLVRVRAEIGGGSYTTISEAMKTWRAEKSASSAPVPVVIPESVSFEITRSGAAVWEAAQSAANAQLNSERAMLADARAEMEAAQGEAAGMADQMESEIESLKIELSERVKDLLKVSDHLKAAHEKNEDREKKIAGLDAIITEKTTAFNTLNEKHTEAAKALSEAEITLKNQSKQVAKIEEKLTISQSDLHALVTENAKNLQQIEFAKEKEVIAEKGTEKVVKQHEKRCITV